MATRGNGLFSSITSMELFHFQKKTVSEIKLFLGHGLYSLFALVRSWLFTPLSKFKNKFDLIFFKYTKGINKFAKMCKFQRFARPSISDLPVSGFSLYSSENINTTTEILFKPIHKSFIGIGNFKFGSVVASMCFCLSVVFGNNQTSFSINDAREIYKRVSRIAYSNIFTFGHKNSVYLLQYSNGNRLINKCQAAETNRAGARASEVIVRPSMKIDERGSRLSATICGQKLAWIC